MVVLISGVNVSAGYLVWEEIKALQMFDKAAADVPVVRTSKLSQDEVS